MDHGNALQDRTAAVRPPAGTSRRSRFGVVEWAIVLFLLSVFAVPTGLILLDRLGYGGFAGLSLLMLVLGGAVLAAVMIVMVSRVFFLINLGRR